MYGRRSAFTLVEVVIAFALVALLTAIAMPNYLRAQTRSKISQNRSDMRRIAAALEAYAIDNPGYPPPWEAGSTGSWGTFLSPPFHARTPSLLTTPIAYLPALPEDPFREAEMSNPPPGYLGGLRHRHVYYNFDYLFVTLAGPPAVNNLTVANELAGPWLIYSVGPDHDEFNTPEGATLVAQRVFRDYDPTNGTNSLGNLLRTADHGEGLGTDPYFWTIP